MSHPRPTVGALEGAAEVERLRGEIDAVDDALYALIARRLEIARALGEAKRTLDRDGRDPAREAAIVARLTADGVDERPVPPDLISLVWGALFTASRWVQRAR